MDVLSKVQRSKLMSCVKSRGNKSTEIRLIKYFRQYKISGWRRHIPIYGNPDFVFNKNRIILFVDGDFWHNNPKFTRTPKSNKAFWRKKLVNNRARDILVNRTLRRNGWIVIRIWESELGTNRMVRKLEPLLRPNNALKPTWPSAKR